MTRLRIGRPCAALIVAPHADDETIGAYGLIRALMSRGTRVRVLVVTDGTASHPNSSRWPPERLKRERRRETRRAMRGVGIGAGAIRFLDLPDGAMQHLDPGQLRPIARAARRVRDLHLIVGPTPDDDHADHRITASVLARTRLPGVRRVAYEVWSPTDRRPHGTALVLAGATQAGKRRTVRGYRTQTGAIVDDPAGFALTPRQIAGFSRQYELFRERR